MATQSNTREQVKEITERLEAGMKDLYTSEKYLSYLQTMSKFHNYSTRNTLLIHMQMPHASKVSGFRAWQEKFGRNVKKGEKGIRIFAPVPVTKKEEKIKFDPDTKVPLLDKEGNILTEESEVTIPRFRPVPVFDVSQTEGKPLPELVENLTGDVLQYQAFVEALIQVSPLPIGFEDLPKSTDGRCYFGDRIAIRSGMSEVQTISAVIHEMTHAKLHDDQRERAGTEEAAQPKDRVTEEIEAESISYVVCQRYGIETAANSFGYLAAWSNGREMKELTASLDTIRKTAAVLIDGIDARFGEICKERGIDLTVEIITAETPLPEQPAIREQKPEKQYDLGYGHMGNGLTVWNRLEEKGGDYVTIAHIDADRSVNFYDNDMPDNIKEQIEREARTSDMTISATQNTPIFDTPAHVGEPEWELTDLLLPDPSIGLSERDLYGYTYNAMLPLTTECALELFDQDHTVYLLYPDNTEGMAFDREEIKNHDGIFGIEHEEWEASQEYQKMAGAAQNSEAVRESELIYGNEPTFGIYQLKCGDEMRDYRFEPLDRLGVHGLSVERGNYELVYTAPLTEKDTLDSLYETFNINHPPDFQGHSLSVSDIIVLQKGGEITSHYVDSFGFSGLSDFLGNEKQPEVDPDQLEPGMESDFIRSELEQAEFGMSKADYIKSNFGEPGSPTLAELESDVAAGKPISLTDLARAVKNEQKPPASKEKPSVLARLQEAKKAAAQSGEQVKSAPKHDNHLEV